MRRALLCHSTCLALLYLCEHLCLLGILKITFKYCLLGVFLITHIRYVQYQKPVVQRDTQKKIFVHIAPSRREPLLKSNKT